MQSYRVHHCVLIILTLTFTTAPGSAAVCSIPVKLHQSVTLPCEYKCSPRLLKWNSIDNRDMIFAHCNQTSCWSVEGYKISHGQYLNGDLSLTITAADFNMRDTYACECGISDISVLRLRIETVSSVIQLKSGKDLVMDLSVPEPVEVIYKPTDSADGDQICNLTQHTLQCKPEYTPRTSLSDRKLTLRHVKLSDSGTYTIRDMENNEDIRVYAVSVTEFPKWATAVMVVLLLLLVPVVIYGVILYRKKGAYEELIKVKNRIRDVAQFIKFYKLEARKQGPENQNSEEMNQINQRLEEVNEAVEKAVEDVEKMIRDLEEQSRDDRNDSDVVESFCDEKRKELKLYKIVYKSKQEGSAEPGGAEVMEKVEAVVNILDGWKREASKPSYAQPTILLFNRCNMVEMYLREIKTWCEEQREELKNIKKQLSGGAEETKAMCNMEKNLDKIIQWCENKKKVLEKYKKHLTPEGRSNKDQAEEGGGDELTHLSRVV